MSEHTPNPNQQPVGALGEISQEPPALEVFLDKHQMKLIVVAVLLTIAAVVFVIVKGLDEAKEKEAGEMLTSAEDVSALKKVTTDYEGTEAAGSAEVLLSEKQWAAGEQEAAIATLKGFVDSGVDHPSMPAAKVSLAGKLDSTGDKDGAKALFTELTDDADAEYLAPYAWISLGDIELEGGNADKAVEAYETVERDFPGTQFAQQAVQRRLVAKAAMPKEVAATISVPEVNFSEAEDGSTEEAAPEAGNLLEGLNGSGLGVPANPMFPEEPVAPAGE